LFHVWIISEFMVLTLVPSFVWKTKQ